MHFEVNFLSFIRVVFRKYDYLRWSKQTDLCEIVFNDLHSRRNGSVSIVYSHLFILTVSFCSSVKVLNTSKDTEIRNLCSLGLQNFSRVKKFHQRCDEDVLCTCRVCSTMTLLFKWLECFASLSFQDVINQFIFINIWVNVITIHDDRLQ